MTEVPHMPLVQHSGGCHCGAVRFSFTGPSDITILDCDCSLCTMIAYQHLIVPKAEFRLEEGEANLATYTFHTGVAQHYFCKTCGIKSFYIPRSHPNDISVNARCLAPGTVTSVKALRFDDKTRSVIED